MQRFFFKTGFMLSLNMMAMGFAYADDMARGVRITCKKAQVHTGQFERVEVTGGGGQYSTTITADGTVVQKVAEDLSYLGYGNIGRVRVTEPFTRRCAPRVVSGVDLDFSCDFSPNSVVEFSGAIDPIVVDGLVVDGDQLTSRAELDIVLGDGAGFFTLELRTVDGRISFHQTDFDRGECIVTPVP